MDKVKTLEKGVLPILVDLVAAFSCSCEGQPSMAAIFGHQPLRFMIQAMRTTRMDDWMRMKRSALTIYEKLSTYVGHLGMLRVYKAKVGYK